MKRVPRIPRRTLRQSKSVAVVNPVSIPCAFCKGMGRDPYGLSSLSNCVACGGKKTQLIRDEPYETCGACLGTGLYFRSHMYCWPCHGKGVVPVRLGIGLANKAESLKSTVGQRQEAGP